MAQLEWVKIELQKQRCQSVFQDMTQERQNQQKIVDLEDKNTHLLKYIESLKKIAVKTFYHASYIRKQRKIKQLKTNAEKALWFFGDIWS